MKELWYRAPAETFTEALPVGSGRLGAMVYGQTQKEKISLNEDTLWSGYPKAENARGTYDGVQEAENLVREGKIKEAEKQFGENAFLVGRQLISRQEIFGLIFLMLERFPITAAVWIWNMQSCLRSFKATDFHIVGRCFVPIPTRYWQFDAFPIIPRHQQKFLWSYPILTICVIIKIRCYIRQLRRCIRLLAILNAKRPWYMILFMKIGHCRMRLL